MGILKRILIFSLAFLFSLISMQNCSSSSSDPVNSQNENFPHSDGNTYFKSTEKVVIEVYYEPGAEPYDGAMGSGKFYWEILQDNLGAIFQFRSAAPELVVPKVLSDMTAIPAQGKTDWTSAEINSLNAQFKGAESTSKEAHFYIYFLNGHFNDGETKPNTIGVSLGGTPIIAIFKDVIQDAGFLPNGPVAKFVEQSTLVHEMGHALGFVNNGVPMASPHQDTEHGAHTTNSDCVMYWLNEGTSDLSDFVRDYISTGNTVMWGDEVLEDAKAFSQ